MITDQFIALREAAERTRDALAKIGYPVSDVAKVALRANGSTEARRMHDAAVHLRDVLAKVWNPQ